jgi:predicted small lipoprotein YifL
MSRRLTITAALGLAALVALGACGRRGDLEPPPNISPDMAKNEAGCAKPTTAGPTDIPADAVPTQSRQGNTNRMPDLQVPPC